MMLYMHMPIRNLHALPPLLSSLPSPFSLLPFLLLPSDLLPILSFDPHVRDTSFELLSTRHTIPIF